MKGFMFVSLAVLTLSAAAVTPAHALTERFDDSRQEVINKLNNRFVDTHQEILVK
ncbi:MAG: hypothetical protein HC769_27900 [Cyanobacteria bacterium CRU_2_1]|nr:hypothetical protein [Cyanobacteria bacterium CRU_2_1]